MANISNQSNELITSQSGLRRRAEQQSIRVFTYPLNILDEETHPSYLVMYFVKPNVSGLSTNSISNRASGSVRGQYNEDTISILQLYMPALTENISHNYDSESGGFVQDIMTNVGSAISGKEGMEMASSAMQAAAATSLETIKVQLAKKSQMFNPQVTGKVLSNRAATMYRGTSVRNQILNFQFNPTSEKELEQVGLIIKEFLVNSSAKNMGQASDEFLSGVKIDGGAIPYNVLQIPSQIMVEERINGNRDKKRYTPKFAFGPAAITNIRISKSPDQIVETFNDTAGDSCTIDVELTLTELRPIHADYWENLTKNIGKPDNGGFFFGSYKGGE